MPDNKNMRSFNEYKTLFGKSQQEILTFRTQILWSMNVFEQRNLLPMLITKRVEPFKSPDYIFELKFDGIRCIAYLDEFGTELRNKQNKGLLLRFPEMCDIHKFIKKRCIPDGELFVMRDGRPSFEAIQPRIVLSNKRRIEEFSRRVPASYVAFDILYCEDRQVTNYH